jgi:hypothetical protein
MSYFQGSKISGSIQFGLFLFFSCDQAIENQRAIHVLYCIYIFIFPKNFYVEFFGLEQIGI